MSDGYITVLYISMDGDGLPQQPQVAPGTKLGDFLSQRGRGDLAKYSMTINYRRAEPNQVLCDGDRISVMPATVRAGFQMPKMMDFRRYLRKHGYVRCRDKATSHSKWKHSKTGKTIIVASDGKEVGLPSLKALGKAEGKTPQDMVDAINRC